MGTNVVLGLDPSRIAEIPALIDRARGKRTSVPPLWDGRASERIVDVLAASPCSIPDARTLVRALVAGEPEDLPGYN